MDTPDYSFMQIVQIKGQEFISVVCVIHVFSKCVKQTSPSKSAQDYFLLDRINEQHLPSVLKICKFSVQAELDCRDIFRLLFKILRSK